MVGGGPGVLCGRGRGVWSGVVRLWCVGVFLGFVVCWRFIVGPVGGAPFLGVCGVCVLCVLSEEGVDFVLAVCFVDDDFPVPKFGWY